MAFCAVASSGIVILANEPIERERMTGYLQGFPAGIQDIRGENANAPQVAGRFVSNEN